MKKVSLLLQSTLTVMSGAIIAPTLPNIQNHFSHIQNIELYSKLILTLPAIIIAISSPLVGWLIDKTGRRNWLLIALVLYGLSGISGLWITDFYLLLFSRALLGLAVAGTMTITVTLAGDYFEDTERNKFVGIQGAFNALGGVIYIGIAGLLSDFHWRLPFILYGMAWILFPFAYSFLPEPNKKTEINNTSNNDTESKIPWIPIGISYIVIFIGMILFYMVPVQMPFYLVQIGVFEGSKAGYIIMVAMLFGALSAANYRRIKSYFSYWTIYSIGFSCMSIGYFVVSYTENYYYILCCMITFGLGVGLIFPNTSLLLMNYTPQKVRGRILGGVSMFVFTGQFLSPIITQQFSNSNNLQNSFFIAACLEIIIAIFILFYSLFEYRQRVNKKVISI